MTAQLTWGTARFRGCTSGIFEGGLSGRFMQLQSRHITKAAVLPRSEFWDPTAVSSGFQVSDPARLTLFGEQSLPPALPAVQAPGGVLCVLFELHGHSGGEAAVSSLAAVWPLPAAPCPRLGCGCPGRAAPQPLTVTSSSSSAMAARRPGTASAARPRPAAPPSCAGRDGRAGRCCRTCPCGGHRRVTVP